MIDLEQLASLIDQANLMQKSLYEMTPGEVEQIVQMVYDCTSPDCCYHYICVQVPSYIAKCTGQEKCKRLIYFAQNKIPKQGSRDD